MTSTQMQVISTLAHLMKTGNKHYVKPAPSTMVDILGRVHQHRIARRTYFDATQGLISAGIIVRKPRYDPRTRPRILQLSSVVMFTLKGAKTLMKIGIAYGYKLYKEITAWMHKPGNPIPKIAEEYNQQTLERIDDERNLKYLRELLLYLDALDKDRRRKKPLRLK